MPNQRKTFRVFVSSTFSDMKAERRLLMNDVFPELERYCSERGAKFQSIDLRWGVTEESQKNQKTLDICINEIHRCQRLSPRPNFIILLGDRYGWQPVPAKIPVAEMEQIFDCCSDNDKSFLKEWYRLDENAVPPEYVLLGWGDRIKEYSEWEAIETRIKQVFRQTIEKIGLSDEDKLKYTASATHFEIMEGILNPPRDVVDAEKHVLAFSRKIEGLPIKEDTADFLDWDFEKGVKDTDAESKLSILKDKLEGKLKGNYAGYDADWDNGSVKIDNPKLITDKIIDHFKQIIDQELAQLTNPDEVEAEQQYHTDFCKRLTRQFRGRGNVLSEIDTYIKSNDSKPFALIGPSGSGKSSVMAKAIEQALDNDPDAVIVYRFIGANAGSTNIISLLHSICAQIASAYDVELESLLEESQREKLFEIWNLTDLFGKCLGLGTTEKPILVFLDALDQLSESENAHALNWLPKELPGHVSLVVSALPELENALAETEVTHLSVLPSTEAEKILRCWLAEAERTLTQDQFDHILTQFSSNGLPLYLRIAFEQACHWRSFDSAPTIPDNIENMIETFLDGLNTEHTEQLVSTAISYMLCGRDKGLTEEEILKLLHRDPEYWPYFLEKSHPAHRAEIESAGQIPVVVWSRLFFDLEQFLTERDSQGERIICFYHRLFNEVATKKYLEDAKKYHERIAEYFEQTPHFLDGKAMKRPNVRKCVEIVRQQILSERFDELEDNLCDLLFIEAKVQAKMVYDLLKDYDEALNALLEYNEERKKEQKHQNRRKAPWSKIKSFLGLSKPTQSSDNTTIQSNEQTQTKPEKNMPSTPRKDRIDFFSRFVNGRSHLFAKPLISRGIAIQQAYDSAESGPVANSAADVIELISNLPMILCAPADRSTFNPSPSLLRLLDGHTETVLTLAVTPDGKKVISGSKDHSIRVWDVKTGQCVRTFYGHTHFVNAVALALDGNCIVSASHDGTIRVWDLEAGECLKTLEGHKGTVNTVAIAPDGKTIVSGGADKTVRIWSLKTGQCDVILKGHTSYVEAVAVIPDGNTIVSGSTDETLRIWDIRKRKCVKILKGQKSPAHSIAANHRFVALAVSLDGKYVISGSFDELVRVWDIKTGKCVTIMEGHNGFVWDIAISLDGKIALSGSSDKSVRFWDIKTGECVRILREHDWSVRAVAISPDGKTAISASDKLVMIWDLEKGMPMGTSTSQRDIVSDIILTPNGKKAVTRGVQDNTIRIWELENGKCLKTLEGHTGWVWDIAITPNGENIVSGCRDKDIRVWELETGVCIKTLKGHLGFVRVIAITPDGKKIVSGSNENSLRVWDLKTGTCLKTLRGHTDYARTVTIAPDGKRAVSGSTDHSLIYWDLETGTIFKALSGHTDSVRDAVISPDGTRLVSIGSYEHFPRLWDLETGVCITKLEGHNEYVCAIAITPDGAKVVSGSIDHCLMIWDMKSGRHLRTLKGHMESVDSIVITPDSTKAISGSSDQTLRLWDLDTGACLFIYYFPSAIKAISPITPDGRFVCGLAHGKVNFLRLVNTNTDAPVTTATRLWLSGSDAQPGQYDEHLTAYCRWCGIRQVVSENSLGQTISCNSCGNQMKLNPFVCDNSDWLD